ncbi:hypothetical protein MTO96_038029 [Rhipicephalus appendiculatus]
MEQKTPGVAQEGTKEGDKPRVVPGTKAETAAGEDDAKAASNSSADVREVDPGGTDVDMTAAGGIATKRAREASDNTGNVGHVRHRRTSNKDSDGAAAYLQTKAKPAA